jgi:hypothetical protein
MFRNNPLVKTIVGLFNIAAGTFVVGTALYVVGLRGPADVSIWTTTITFLLAILLAIIVAPLLIGSWLLCLILPGRTRYSRP